MLGSPTLGNPHMVFIVFSYVSVGFQFLRVWAVFGPFLGLYHLGLESLGLGVRGGPNSKLFKVS